MPHLPLVDESSESQNDRSLRGVGDDARELSQVYFADVNIVGNAVSTESYQTPESIKFQELCVGTFTVQGPYFVRALQKWEESNSTDVTFKSVQNARGVMTYSEAESAEGEPTGDDPTDPYAGGLSTGALAGIAAASVFCFVIFLIFLAARARGRKRRYQDVESAKSGSTKSRTKDYLSNVHPDGPSPTNSNATRSTVSSKDQSLRTITPVSIRSKANEIEVDMIPESFSGNTGGKSKSSLKSKVSSMHSRVRRDLVAPPGKLGITVANTAGFVST